MTQKCGYVAFHGRPNAGKSTLLNAMIGAKLASVSDKPQTTRNKILGIHTEGNTQLVIIDTPGFHNAKGRSKLNNAMNSVAWNAVSDADVLCYLIDAAQGWHDEDTSYLSEIIAKSKIPIMLLATKIDASKKNVIEKNIEVIQEQWRKLSEDNPEFLQKLLKPVPYEISAKRPESVRELRSILQMQIPDGAFLYPADDLSDVPQRNQFAELIREQLFRQLDLELPYSCGVKIDTVDESQANITKIQATIYVAKPAHKGIVIGQGGKTLKSIGMEARKELERQIDQKVYLELHVAVDENWTNNIQAISEYEGIKPF